MKGVNESDTSEVTDSPERGVSTFCFSRANGGRKKVMSFSRRLRKLNGPELCTGFALKLSIYRWRCC